MASARSNKSNSGGRDEQKPSRSLRAEAAANNKAKISYLEEMDEDRINEEKAQFRYEEMMHEFKHLTRRSDNDEENENLERFYKNNAPKKKQETAVVAAASNHGHSRRAPSSTGSTNGSEKDSYVRNEIRAPNELKEEFLVYIMEKKWEDAFKLCKFILLYEPDNPIAREYFPLIEFKLNQSESESDDEDTDDDDDDDDGDGDSDKDDDDDDEDEDSESDEDEDEYKNEDRKRQEEEEIRNIREMYKQMKPKEEESRIRSSGSTSSRSNRNAAAAAAATSSSSNSKNTKSVANSSIKKPSK